MRTPYCIQITCCVHDIINRSKDTITELQLKSSSLSLILKDRSEEGVGGNCETSFVLFFLAKNFEVFKSTIKIQSPIYTIF